MALTAGGEGREESKEERLAELGCGFNKVLGQSYRDLWNWDDPSESSCPGAKRMRIYNPTSIVGCSGPRKQEGGMTE